MFARVFFTLVGIAFAAPLASLAQNSGVPSYAKVRQSLALVGVEGTDKSVVYGTAFCIESDERHSYFLTSAHVVGGNDIVGIRLEADHQFYKGFVLRTSVAPLDAAVIEIPKGKVPALLLSRANVSPGAPIAVIGYPSIQLETDFQPSVHAGTVSDIMQRYYIEYDAITDHGNSGGPVFDPQTGVVYGIATAIVPSETARAVQSNIAILIDEVLPFIGNAGVHPSFPPVVEQTASASPIASPSITTATITPSIAILSSPSPAPAKTMIPLPSPIPAPEAMPSSLQSQSIAPSSSPLRAPVAKASPNAKSSTFEDALRTCTGPCDGGIII